MVRQKAVTASVLIATFNRAALLDECLGALARQPFRHGDEVIVVDNGSTDNTHHVILGHQFRFPVPLRGLFEPRAGKSRALARALDIASGDIFAFTDDDVNVETGWLDAVRRSLSDDQQRIGRADMVGGPVLPRWESQAPRWLRVHDDAFGRLAAPLALLNFGAAPSELGERTFLGANLAVRREVIDRVGGFAPHLGKLRGTLLSGEDSDFCQRAQEAGFRALYAPDLTVRHWVPEHRTRIAYFIRWFFWSGVTHAALDDNKESPGRSVLGVPAYLFKRLAGGCSRSVLELCRGRAVQAMAAGTEVAFALGYAAKRWGLVALDAEPRPGVKQVA